MATSYEKIPQPAYEVASQPQSDIEKGAPASYGTFQVSESKEEGKKERSRAQGGHLSRVLMALFLSLFAVGAMTAFAHVVVTIFFL